MAERNDAVSEPRRLVLVDGYSYLYRAFHVPNLQRLTTSAGEPTGAIYGFINMIRRLRTDHEPDLIAVILDAPGPTFRDELFAAYKAQRPPMPDELRAQIDPLIEIVRAMGLPLLREPGVEADDVIGTLVHGATARDLETLIATSDKDMAQLVSDKVRLVDTLSDRILDPDGVREKFGVPPERMIDYLALVGDTSDNIPGVPGVGPKTAAKWLAEFGDLDTIVARAEEIPGKIGEKLRASLSQLELSRQLATIQQNLDLGLDLADLVPGDPDLAALRQLYERLELRSFLKALDSDDPRPPQAAPRDYATITTKAALKAWLKRLMAAELVAFDTETTSLSYMEAELVGLSFAVAPGEAAYVPVAHRYAGAPQQLSREEVLDLLRPWLEDDSHQKLGHHLKYDAHVLHNHGLELAGMRFDTMLESYVLDSTATRHDLDAVARKYLGIETITYEQVAGKGAKQLRFDDVPVEQAAPYAAEDADVALQLHQKLWPQLEATGHLAELYETLEQPLVPVLKRIEEHGVLVDTAVLRKLSDEFAKKMAAVESAAHGEAGRPFNLGSPKQLQEILFEELGLPVLRKTPKGQPSTAEDALQELAEYELPRLVLEYRGLSKLKSTYTDKLPLQVVGSTGRIHTSYHQAVAATGRLSSSDPNLQNIPIRTEEGRRIRQAFIAPPGHLLLAADYSQIELRIMAHISGDEGLLRAFREDRDIHEATAAEVFGVAPGKVSADQRRSAKAINFGLIYGMSAFGLARQLGIARDEAQTYVDQYFARYPGVKAYMEATRAQAREQGFVETVFGRRLYLPDIQARQVQRRQYAERSAINAPMQGTAADIIKKAMIAVDGWLLRKRVPARIIMQVHDELVLEVREDRVSEVRDRVHQLMEQAAELSVALKVESGTGANWDEAH